MTDTALNTTSELTPEQELDMLKRKAAMMGITHSNNISPATLREKINAKLAGEEAPAEMPSQPNALEMSIQASEAQAAKDEAASIASAAAVTAEAEKPVVVMSIRQYMLQEEMKLVRCRITNLDPKKKDLPGEIITVANEYLGTIRKFVPFGEQTDEGYHIPYCIYKFLDARKFVSITTKKDRRTGQLEVTNRDAKEFSLEVMEPLTKRELQDLATAQIAAGSVE